MLVLIGSEDHADCIANKYPESYTHSREFGIHPTLDPLKYQNDAQWLMNKAQELDKHIIHPIPVGMKVLLTGPYAYVNLPAHSLYEAMFNGLQNFTTASVKRLAVSDHHQYLQLSIKPRALIVLNFNEQSLLSIRGL